MTWRFRLRVIWSVLRGHKYYIDPYLLPRDTSTER